MATNAMQWDGTPGHYEVWYLSATDPASGVGIWIRYTLLAPLAGEPTCSLWAMFMDPAPIARKRTLPSTALKAQREPFALKIDDAELDDNGTRGAIDDVSWELRWQAGHDGYDHVSPLLQRARVAKTILTLPHADLAVSGTLTLPGRGTLELAGARGGQAHLWGSKHASRWTWAHCNDLRLPDGEPVRDSFIDGVSVFVPRLGREVGPSSPVVGRLLGEDFLATSPAAVLRNRSRFAATGWHLEATAGARRIWLDVDAARERLVGVTYTDPDGEHAYCYNSEVASLRLRVFDRTARGRHGWTLRQELAAPGLAHFEYAQREPLADVPLLLE